MPNAESPPSPAAASLRQKAATTFRVIRVRLRFVAVLVVAFLIVGRWDVLRNYWDSFTRQAGGREAASMAVSNDTEYFCPMDPGVVSDWPGKCSICNMALVRRKRGEAAPLPSGVVARMQFSPYRLQLAGIQTSPVSYQPLEYEVVTTGHVACDEQKAQRVVAPRAGRVTEVAALADWSPVKEGDRLVTVDAGEGSEQAVVVRAPGAGRLMGLKVRPGDEVAAGQLLAEVADTSTVVVSGEIFENDLPFVHEGQAVEATAEALAGRGPYRGRVRSVRPAGASNAPAFQVEAVLDNPRNELWPGLGLVLRIRAEMAAIEPFRSQPSDPPPLRRDEPRVVFVCADHPEVMREHAGNCPTDGKNLERLPLAENQRLRWWCPMHPDVTADQPGKSCEPCGGMTLGPRVVTYSPKGQVLTVPASAVVDTGAATVVYVDRGAGMFDGVTVVLGPRCGAFYPVVRGLENGQRVATTGAFLIDAETRLNPSLAAGYFGAARGDAAGERPAIGGPASGARAETPAPAPQPGLSASDQLLVDRQKTCPVTGKALGSMGTPVRVVVNGQTVFLCCEGCEARLRASADRLVPRAKK